MARRFTCACILGAFTAISAAACSVNSEGLGTAIDEDSGLPDTSSPDTGAVDSGSPDSSVSDSGTDSSPDTSLDTKADSLADTSTDTSTDSDSDAADSAADTSPEADVVTEPKCDATKSPNEDTCVISESYGVFVSSSAGDDTTGLGTRKSPYKTLAKAITQASAANKRVYACGEKFSEAVVVPSNVAVFGALNCASADWPYNAQTRTVVNAPAGSFSALRGFQSNSCS
jgi:hypothetical protein